MFDNCSIFHYEHKIQNNYIYMQVKINFLNQTIFLAALSSNTPDKII